MRASLAPLQNKGVTLLMTLNEENIPEMLHDLELSEFYGSIELKFEAGHIVIVRKVETYKTSTCRDNRGQQSGKG
jgi:hypothetical protein